MDDFNINRAVAKKLGYLVQEIDDGSKLGMTTDFHTNFPAVVWIACVNNGEQGEPWHQFCPTLSWEDAGPIIADNMISLKDTLYGNFWRAQKEIDDGETQYTVAEYVDESPLRAAMTVFLNIDDKYLSINKP